MNVYKNREERADWYILVTRSPNTCGYCYQERVQLGNECRNMCLCMNHEDSFPLLNAFSVSNVTGSFAASFGTLTVLVDHEDLLCNDILHKNVSLTLN